jgi:hypothetical protein
MPSMRLTPPGRACGPGASECWGCGPGDGLVRGPAEGRRLGGLRRGGPALTRSPGHGCSISGRNGQIAARCTRDTGSACGCAVGRSGSGGDHQPRGRRSAGAAAGFTSYRVRADLALLPIAEVLSCQAAGMVPLDGRLPAGFTAGHVRGAVSIGLGGDFEGCAGAVLKPDRDVVLVGVARSRRWWARGLAHPAPGRPVVTGGFATRGRGTAVARRR